MLGVVLLGVMAGYSVMATHDYFAWNRARWNAIHAAERMGAGGRIITLSSGVTRQAYPDLLAYAMSKAAVDVMARTLAKELAPRGITVNVVAPGVVDTDMNAHWLRGDDEARAAAASAFGRLGMSLDVGRTRLLLAQALAASELEPAIAEARSALGCFEELGAGRDADTAAAFLRSLGVKAARSGPRGIGVLTKRELEVLGLLGEGLSNPDIAARLFISRRTVEHHVARVLSKLELKGRGEAAAYALRNLATDTNSAAR